MDLSGLTDYLETQQIAFTSLLRNTKNIDPKDLKSVLIKHHAQLIMIAKGRYPIEVISPVPGTPVRPSAGSGKGINKRHFIENSSDDGDMYEPPTKVKTSSGIYSYTSKPTNKSNSASTPTKLKTSAPDSSNPHSSPFEARGRMRPAGASNLFKKELNYSQTPNGYKKYDVIDLSSGPADTSDSEFAEAKEVKDSESEFVGSDGEFQKQMPALRANNARRGGTARRGKAAAKNTPSKSKKTSSAAKGSFESPSGHSDENGYPVKKSASSGRQSKLNGKLESKTGLTAEEILTFRNQIAAFEKQLIETQLQLTKTDNFLARRNILGKVQELKESIASKKLLLGEGPKKKGRKPMAATVEDASEEDDDSLFVPKGL